MGGFQRGPGPVRGLFPRSGCPYNPLFKMKDASSNSVKIATVLLSAIAAGLAGLLLYQSQTHQALPGCDGGSACDTVLSSKWSLWFGIPVSLLALANYTAMFAAAISHDPKDKKPQLSITLTLAVSAFATLAAAAWFVSVQVIAIGAMCKYCMGTHAVGVAAAVLCLVTVTPRIELKQLMSATAAAMVLVGVMIVGQVMGEAPAGPDALITFADDTPLPEPGLQAPAAYGPLGVDPLAVDPLPPKINAPLPDPTPVQPTLEPTPTTPPPTAGPRIVKLNGGRMEIDTTAVPIIGDPHAPIILAVLYDYRCSHCRDTRKMLEKTKSRHGNKLAILCLPTPLSSKCNRLIRQYNPNNRYSCDLAKVSLAFWKVDPDQWAEFDKLMYSSEDHHSPARSQIAAGKMVKDKDLTKELRGEWVDEQIKQDVLYYAAAAKSSGNSMLPILISTHGIMNGTPKHPLDIDDLINGKRR